MKIIPIQAAGLGLWLLSFLLFDVTLIERILLFAILVIIPLVLYIIKTKDRHGTYLRAVVWSAYAYPIGALAAYISFFFDPGILAGLLSLAWLGVTALISLQGLSRLLARGFYSIEEVSIDVGLMYILLGGMWLSIARFGLDVMDFGPTIILLTAIHFHFSALITPIFTGLAGRLWVEKRGKLPTGFRVMAIGIMVSSLGIAVGITYSRAIEFAFVVVFVLCLFAYAYYVVIGLRQAVTSAVAYSLLVISSFIILFTMSLAFYYGVGRVLRIETINIPDMVWLHGIGNAFGFVLLGVLGWLLVMPKMQRNPYGIPFSRVYGSGRVGTDFFARNDFLAKDGRTHSGLVENFAAFEQTGFSVAIIHPAIRRFYERTVDHSLVSTTTWHGMFARFSPIYKAMSRRIEQLDLPLNGEKELAVNSRIVALDSEKDGRSSVRAWIRSAKDTEKAVFVAAYSEHSYEEKSYLNIALPLVFGQLTGVLRLAHPDDEGNRDGLVLTSVKNPVNKGDEGTYFVTKWFSVRLPIDEHFVVETGAAEGELKANHSMWLFGRKFLTIAYLIRDER